MFKDGEELIDYCVDNNLRTVEEMANEVNYSTAWVYKQLKKYNISYKKDITNLIDFNKVVEEEYDDWVRSCGDQWGEVEDDEWVAYNEGSIEYGDSGCRRGVTHRVFKGYPYNSYVFIPDNIPDDILRGCGDDYCTDIEYKYIFISPEGEYFHAHKLKPMCEKLGVNYQAACDCVRGRTAKTVTDWQVKRTKDFYKV